MKYLNAKNTAYGEDRRTYKVGVNGVASTDRAFNVSYDNGRVECYLNGVRLFPGDDFTKASSGIGTNITLVSDIGANNVLEVVGYQGINQGNALVEDNFVVGTDSTGSGGAYDGTSGTNSAWDDTFPVASSPGDTVSVWRNGVKLVPVTDYTVNPSASTVYLVSPAVTGDEITVQVVGGVIHNNGLTVNSGSNSFFLPTTRGTDAYVLTRDDTIGTGGTTWKETELAPATTSISPNEVESSPPGGGDITITLTGTNYATSGMTVHFLANSGSNITSGITVTHGTSTSFTVTVPRSSFVNANEPYSIKVTKTSGLTHTLDNALRVDNAPSWSDYVAGLTGSPPVVASIGDNISSATHATLSATDAEGDTVTYSETTNVLTNAGMSLSSAGAITGTPTPVSSDTNYDFTARATSTGDGGATAKTTDQNFRFTITNYISQLFAGKIYDGLGNQPKYVQFDETANGTATDFAPDLVWVKNREATQHHVLFDTLRGATWRLMPNLTNGQDQQSQYLTDFEADGFDVGQPNDAMNGSGVGYIAWGWKAGGQPSGYGKKKVNGTESNITEATSSSGDGDYYNLKSHDDSTYGMKQSINSFEGFSITKYSLGGTSGYGWFKHGFTGDPDFVIHRRIDDTYNWDTWHSSLRSAGNWGSDMILWLNEPNSLSTMSSNNRQNVFRDSSTTGFPKGDGKIYIDRGSAYGSDLNDEFICYAWQAKTGRSAFGKYTGQITSAPSEGDAGYCGFKPRFVMIKCTSSGHSWQIYDGFRDTDDSAQRYLKANSNDYEISNTAREVHFTTNGFTTDSYVSIGGSGEDFIFVAFA